ncbi:response regulator [Leptospira bourretii]|uniref:Response regulator n=1 Tax=Leptospira bourretii TaxID=2484962 RepID=A0A4R9IPP5_9LEPT|nr:response regulator [Leptospira bourretii]TGK90115.1 response regulator [Leptospira bourretii]TGK93862.1 response regulator [Leptospira bourretii]TGL22867.1 response regulator [Leptospira bourretii]TGL27395.1 response regulator [Leptospira bourretii]
MINLLAVDDEMINLMIIDESLSDKGFTVVKAKDGEEAYQILSSGSTLFHAIILDRLMPKMDGIELLKKIKRSEKYKDIPVIFQTAMSSVTDMTEGLDAGAFYYLTKPYSRTLLIRIVQTAVEHFIKLQRAKEDLHKGMGALRHMVTGEFRIRSIRESHELAPLLANACPDPERVLTGIMEILNNAIEHGNLGISYQEKSELHDNDKLMEEIFRRLDTPEFKDKFVKVTFEKNEERIEIRVSDQGKGFDWQRYLSVEAMTKNAFKTHGRGIFMARKLSFDDLSYTDEGRTAVIRIDLSNKQGNLLTDFQE